MEITIKIPNSIQEYCKEKGYSEEQTKKLFQSFLDNLFEDADMYNHLVTDFELWMEDGGSELLEE
jgi:hypothetical protein